MVLQFLVGCIVSVINIMIHALVTVGVVGIARSTGLRQTGRPRLHLMIVMISTAAALMVAHTLEVFVWALAYAVVGAAPAGSDLLYFAFVNYTTLGYGDVTPVKAWQLTGPITAMNGILMFGWSTAVLFEVLRKTLEQLASIGAAGFSSADRGQRAAGGPEARSGVDCC
jgi:Ion channel